MWVMGLGLEEASKRIAANNDSGCETLQGELVPLELFSYDNPKMGCVLQESIRSIKINGISVCLLLPISLMPFCCIFVGAFV